MSRDFFRDMVKQIGDVDTHIADDGLHSSEFAGTMDTGSYLLNAALSGSIYGGVPNNKITVFAGESATGKTFFVLGLVQQFLKDNPEAGVIYYDTEAAVTKEMFVARGIDPKRVVISEQATVQSFRTHASRILDNYLKVPEKERPKMLMVLDSLGQLSTEKEMEDISEGKNTRDMTRSQLIRGAFRALSLKLARANVSLLVTNHIFNVIGAYVPTKDRGGGEGLKYAASQILFLSKKKDRDGTEVVGNIIHCRLAKSRFTKENKSIDVRLSYDQGLNRYYGLLDLAEKHGIIKKIANRFEMPDGGKFYGKQIEEDPDRFFTKELLDAIDSVASKEFKYGQGEQSEVEHDEESAEQSVG